MEDQKTKNQSLVPHLGFLGTIDLITTGASSRNVTVTVSIEDKKYWISINSKTGKPKPIPPQINVYMDDSKTKQGAGSSFVILKGKNDVL